MGRRKVNDPITEAIAFKVDKKTKDRVVEIAEKNGINVTQYMRILVKREIVKKANLLEVA